MLKRIAFLLAAVLPNNGHVIWPWREAGAKAIAEFTGAPYRKVEPLALAGKIALTGEARGKFEAYGKRPPHRAFAAHPNGHFFWTAGWDSAEDVAQYTLFNCGMHYGIDVFASGRQHCVLIDVDGRDPRK